MPASFHGCCVVQITFAHLELPPDDLIPGLCVSGNVDSLEIDLLSLADIIGDVDEPLFRIHGGKGVDFGIGVSLVPIEIGDVPDIFLD